MWIPHLLPGFPSEAVISLREGHTDLFEVPDWFKKEIGMSNLYIKLEGQLPSQSFKDRGMAVAISDANRLQRLHSPSKRWTVLCASTGDTSAAAALYTAYARDRLVCVVVLPYQGVSEGQMFQARSHGATIVCVDDPDGFDACMRLAEEYCRRNRETVMVNSENAMRIVGQESIALEICQDLTWRAPNWIAIPCGNGGNLTAFLVSLLRMKNRLLIDRLPGIIVAQAERANTLVRWGRSGFQEYAPRVRQPSVASAMNIQDPVSFSRIEKFRTPFDMRFYDVPEDRIASTRTRFTGAGATICPQTAVALDGVLQAYQDGTIAHDDTVVVIGTASALKFVRVEELYENERVIPASVQHMENALEEMNAV